MNIMKNIGLRKLFFLLAAAGMASLLTSCFYFEMNRNTKNLARIRKGMTRKQVIEIMGEPVRGEIYCSDKVLYYYTRQRWMDGLTTRDECTPIAFDEYDRVVGWGPDFHTGVYDFLANPTPIDKKQK
ncbi:MAG: Outer membrane protein assembly factor BamE [Lentisphaerae bacterium ADurb.Bin242]|nr:MAG: Outer membrane protein assembly factor BamE [Lentisphaerae bacterium ADurb.Bin242]